MPRFLLFLIKWDCVDVVLLRVTRPLVDKVMQLLVAEAVWSMSRFIQSLADRVYVDVTSKC